ncbi:MAG TPA: hypothetical protein VKZ84_03120 [Bacteriovoracaceae bacterium]|nr:hypothetical protein [Bacteriovoracaceae bacterium]
MSDSAAKDEIEEVTETDSDSANAGTELPNEPTIIRKLELAELDVEEESAPGSEIIVQDEPSFSTDPELYAEAFSDNQQQEHQDKNEEELPPEEVQAVQEGEEIKENHEEVSNEVIDEAPLFTPEEMETTPEPPSHASTPFVAATNSPAFDPEKFKDLSVFDKLDKLVYLEKIDRLDEKLEALHNLNQLLNMHQEALQPLNTLEKLNNLKLLNKLDKLVDLKRIDELKNLDSLKQLENLKRMDELEKLQSLTDLRSLDQLSNLQSLANLEKLDRLDDLEKLDGLEQLEHLEKLELLDNEKFIKKLERLDKLSLLNKKFSTIVMTQFIGLFLDLLKFGCAVALVFFLLTSELGRKFTAQSLTAVGFGSPAQSSLGLLLLQGQVEEPRFYEIIENVRNKIKSELHAALSTGNTLTLSQRAKMLEDVLAYNYKYKDIDLKEEALQQAKRQIIDAKNLVLPKIQFDMAIAKNHGNDEVEKELKELKVLFANQNYPEVLNRFKFSKLKEESVKLAIIVATLELQLEDPKTLQQLMVP